jgi:Nucleotide modification associated domain 1
MTQTDLQYASVIDFCQNLFIKKNNDYGTAWRILRLPSITDQIFIKASRIRSIQEKGKMLVNEDINAEFVGIINYCVMALIQIHLPANAPLDIKTDELSKHYAMQVAHTKDLLFKKNHDYNEAWRSMRVSSITDIILMKLLRIKQIEDNAGQTLVSEGVEANYQDILNYAVFCLILNNFAQ